MESQVSGQVSSLKSHVFKLKVNFSTLGYVRFRVLNFGPEKLQT